MSVIKTIKFILFFQFLSLCVIAAFAIFLPVTLTIAGTVLLVTLAASLASVYVFVPILRWWLGGL